MSDKPLVNEVKMPKIKVGSSVLANIHAFSSAFAIFFGVMAIFAAIARFTQDAKNAWNFDIPFLGNIFGANLAYVTGRFSIYELIAGLAALAAGITAIVILHKLTDASAVKKAWSRVMVVAGIFAAVFAVEAIATIIYSLMTLSLKNVQGDIWLKGFLPIVICLATAIGVFFLAMPIAKGKTSFLRAVSYIGIGVSALALILVFISGIVGVNSKSKSSSTVDDWLDSYSRYLED